MRRRIPSPTGRHRRQPTSVYCTVPKMVHCTILSQPLSKGNGYIHKPIKTRCIPLRISSSHLSRPSWYDYHRYLWLFKTHVPSRSDTSRVRPTRMHREVITSLRGHHAALFTLFTAFDRPGASYPQERESFRVSLTKEKVRALVSVCLCLSIAPAAHALSLMQCVFFT